MVLSKITLGILAIVLVAVLLVISYIAYLLNKKNKLEKQNSERIQAKLDRMVEESTRGERLEQEHHKLMEERKAWKEKARVIQCKREAYEEEKKAKQ